LDKVAPELLEKRAVQPIALTNRREIGRIRAFTGKDDGDIAGSEMEGN